MCGSDQEPQCHEMGQATLLNLKFNLQASQRLLRVPGNGHTSLSSPKVKGAAELFCCHCSEFRAGRSGANAKSSIPSRYGLTRQRRGVWGQGSGTTGRTALLFSPQQQAFPSSESSFQGREGHRKLNIIYALLIEIKYKIQSRIARV